MRIKIPISINTWPQAILFSFFTGLVSFFVFLFLEVIFGDILKDTLDAEYQAEMYFNINLILYLGLGFVFFVSWFINFITLRKSYISETIIVSNIIVLIFVGVILFFISWISILVEYSDLYQQLMIYEQIKLTPHFYSLFSIYILPNPVFFWILGFVIYHSLLIIFIKIFFVKKKFIRKRGNRNNWKSSFKKRKKD